MFQVEKGLNRCSARPLDNDVPPDILDQFMCLWTECQFASNDLNMFFNHCVSHSYQFDEYKCQWQDCSYKTNRQHTLAKHLTTHTGEKAAACPQCFTVFASLDKFKDHLIRQLDDPSKLTHNCSRCQAVFASAGLLAQHANKHVNKVRCCICSMFFPCKSSLSNHMLWKHTTVKPFKCPSCDFCTKTQHNLQYHIDKSHNDVNPIESVPCYLSVRVAYFSREEFVCNDCDKIFKDSRALQVHRSKVGHDTQIEESKNERYQCHLCEKNFARGHSLTTHLKTTHELAKSRGRSRYVKNPKNGCYQLQTSQLLSIELARDTLGEDAIYNLILN
ncbi:hypothetical protein Ciccas_003750 [Cichlidogyrus casuarinus]|uniref:C2H2-type domain-containing protein n=1 Tax=Cichlidogyrus casuarinus TaxID=1844966 RepID=A0ABD2QDI0_9PLAT